MFGLRVPDPDEALLISGRKGKSGAPFRVVVGHRVFVMPMISRAKTLTLAMQEADVAENCLSSEKVTLQLKATCAFKVDSNEQSIIDAGQRFLSDQRQMPVLVGQIASGHLRGIVGDMTVEEIISKRQTLAEQVLDASKSELGGLGLKVDSFQITSVDDRDPRTGESQGYIDSLRAPNIARVKRDAAIAQAQADQAAAEASQESQRQQADFARETAVKKAAYDAEVNVATAERDRKTQEANAARDAAVGKANAVAAQSGPLAEATAQQDVIAEQTKVAERNSALKQKQLEADVVRPAEAEAKKVELSAKAESEATRLHAEAAASSNRVALDQLLIEQMPAVTQAIAHELSTANITLLNGSEGLSELAAGIVTQMGAILGAARQVSSPNGNNPEKERVTA